MKTDRMSEISMFLEEVSALEVRFRARLSWNYHNKIPHLTVADEHYTNEAVLGRGDTDGFEVLALS